MKTFINPAAAFFWAQDAEGRAAINDRVHGAFSFLAAGQRYTTGRGLTCRAEEWSR